MFPSGTALLGNYPGSGGAHSALPQEVWNDTEPGLKAASLTPPRFELSQGCGASGDVAQSPPAHPDPGRTPKPGRDALGESGPPELHGSIPGMLRESQGLLGSMDPSQGCSSHRHEPHFCPLAAPRAGVWEQGRAGFRERGLLTPRTRSCGCCLLQHLPAAAAAPPGRQPAVGAGGFLSCQRHEAGTTPRTIPSIPPRAPPSILGMVQRGEARHKGCAKHKSGPHPPLPPPARVLRRSPVLRYLRAPWPLPWPCPHRARGGGIPGTRFAVTSAFRATQTPARSCSVGRPVGPSWGLPPGQEAPLWGAAHTLPPSPRGARSPPALGSPTLGVTSFPRGLCKPQPLFRAPSVPRPAGGAGGRCPRRPAGAGAGAGVALGPRARPSPVSPAAGSAARSSAQVSPGRKGLGRDWAPGMLWVPEGCSASLRVPRSVLVPGGLGTWER